jgi:cytidylate kinase
MTQKVLVEVRGPAGACKSAIAQVIAEALRKAGIVTKTDVSITLREPEALNTVLHGLKTKGGVQVEVKEFQT